MLTKKKTTQLYELLVKFIEDISETSDNSDDREEIEILLDVTDAAINFKKKIEPIL